ncbi:MAG: SUMF1/EgtB/PvdO family nonheme iron enzyme, partial [Myxococcales bacterium]|nr:SUMF1/EgtB/PvdO family nonheme iron enzyme [Myxococcales bacterium]
SSARGGFAHVLGRGVTLPDDGEAGSADAGPSPADSDALGAPPASGPCDAGMVEIQGEGLHFCIDRAEYPGLDRAPATEVDLPHARQACAARGHALCTEAQWMRACRGASGWLFPYGPRREAGRCRVGDASAHPGPSGADPHCVTPEGVLDLVGNVAEWTEEGVVLGGSVRSKKSVSCAHRQDVPAQDKRPAVGFRCCAPPSSGGGDSGATDGG